MDDKNKTQKEMAEYIVKWLIDGDLDLGSALGCGRSLPAYVDAHHVEFVRVDSFDNHIYVSLNDILFNHEVAKKIFGEESVCIVCGVRSKAVKFVGGCEHDIVFPSCSFNAKPSYQYHLQQMVISDNPIKYVYDYLKSKEKENENI